MRVEPGSRRFLALLVTWAHGQVQRSTEVSPAVHQTVITASSLRQGAPAQHALLYI